MAARKKSNNGPAVAAGYPERERKYEAQDALRTLARADEIRSNKSFMRDVKAEAKSQIKTVGRVLGPTKKKGG